MKNDISCKVAENRGAFEHRSQKMNQFEFESIHQMWIHALYLKKKWNYFILFLLFYFIILSGAMFAGDTYMKENINFWWVEIRRIHEC